MRLTFIVLVTAFALFGEARKAPAIVADYVAAVGGQAAVDKLATREVKADLHHGPKITLIWQKPNKVLYTSKARRMGFDGSGGWTILEKKKKLQKLPRGMDIVLQMDANPLRYVHIGDLYDELNDAPAEEIDGDAMDVVVAPNKLAATKFYFDEKTHLLRRVVETGETTAYFKKTVDYLDYQAVDGVQFPYRIVHSSTEPGGEGEDLRVKQIRHNIPVAAGIFDKPLATSSTFGGKR